jgi:AraC family transcriptional regulator, regulatory protein of adaptative response / methylated-DNA-[protein]-cysteine methyltransferase
MIDTTERTRRHATELDPRWAMVLARDPDHSGDFYYAVRTTGIYCRPSCPSRRAKAENVSFFDSCAAAERAGFRPCRRCKPRAPSLADQRAELVARVCRYIDAATETPTLARLARRAGLSAYHFHRVFKSVTGLSPRAYVLARRAQRLSGELRRGGTVTQAILDAGYNSGGHFYATSQQLLGMTPRSYRDGGANAEIRFAVAECTLGQVLVARSDKGICAISLGEEPGGLVRELQERFPKARLIGGDADFGRWVAQVVRLVDTPAVGLRLPLDIRGTAFQRRVWRALQQIPVGATASYADIAQRIGAPTAVRAVAQACAANALAVAIPCHRVVRRDGALSGYRWGPGRKRALLEREGAASAEVPR